MMDQERQRESKKLSDDRQRLFDQMRQELLSDLENIKLQQMTRLLSRNTASGTGFDERVVLAGTIKDGQLLLPWEDLPAARMFRSQLNEGAFAARIREASALEGSHRFADAANSCRLTISEFRDPAQQAYARLLLASALQKEGKQSESVIEYQRVLSTPPDIVDENGVPFGLFAATLLHTEKEDRDSLVEWVHTIGDPARIIPTEAIVIARDLADNLKLPDDSAKLNSMIRDHAQADALQRDFTKTIPQTGKEPVWVLYGNPAWFASAAFPAGTQDGLLIAVRSEAVLKPKQIRLAAVDEADGQSLDENFQGVRVVLTAPPQQESNARKSLLALGLLLAIACTILAGYLLWRDVQRDLRMSELRSQFVSSVSHELRTPLAAIRMFTETLRLDEEVDTQTRNAYLDTVLHESERLSRLVDNVLDFGKIERGKKVYRFQPLCLDEVVEKAARSAQYPLEQAGFTLNTEIDHGIPSVSADSDALQQAILNLLSNAMKYSGDSRRIDLRLDRVNGRARIHVTDQGIGIATDDQKHIFERFYRAPAAENNNIPGTGLGLTIVAHIAKAHGGDVRITSSPGNGSKFTIELPLEVRA
jgi:signal transduction histidine kinase